ncbi:DUF3618 domain-containing protein [Roseomonas sp. SSH11]|uniref:DUF3618 domain-containing protein n=1 Tax=Pararoseomonas baculiformis TaxID=2820812 RepID=A0ABS4AJB2_9PROT|nr:DUF3618 domain-containing protein [Pararoseomonas baculiformis]MBP0446966.1 DUF3618 domain-containing protein [Pararoseomonas baculiformis]
MSGTTTDPGDKSSRQIETEVERTRADVSGTLDALRDRLSPSQMMDQAIDQIADYARGSGGADFARNLGTAVRDNPLPVMLIGAGIAWMLLSKNEPRSRDPYAHRDTGQRLLPPPETDAFVGSMPIGSSRGSSSTRDRLSGAASAVQDGAGRAADTVSDAASRIGSAVSDAASAVGAAASRVAEMGSDLVGSASDAAGRAARGVGSAGYHAAGAAGDGYDAVRRRASGAVGGVNRGVGELTEAHPLLLGALGMALGATIGAVLPRTRTEDRLMGEVRDELADRAADAAQESYDSVRTAATEGLNQVQDQLASSYAETKEGLDKGGLGSAGDVLSKAAGDVTRAAGDALRNVADEAKRNVDEAGGTSSPKPTGSV